jgi:NAD(P)-dependent dehydrogenase (short-subunit alcohol dehydrogenase family)
MQLPRTPSLRLDGRRALVTGASRGIGLAAAAALAEAGAHVCLAARSLDDVEAGAKAIRDAGGSAQAARLDVTDRAEVDRLVGATGPYDILVNNAGIGRHAAFLESGPEHFDPVMDVNLRAAFFVSQAVARGLVAAGRGGSIITISSQMGHVGGPQRAVYSASKHAIEGLTKALAIELGPLGIRVNTICPTFIETDLTRRGLANPEFKAWVLSKIKLGRIGQVEDLMAPIVFLASDGAALITGSALMVDGGWTAE